MYFLGGMTIVDVGWVNPQVAYVDFVSQFDDGFLWQLYANRTLVGSTAIPSERRIYGQVPTSALPTPITLVRVDQDSVLVDYGPDLPHPPWLPCNSYNLNWTTASMPADTDHFDVIASRVAGAAIDLTNVLARVPFVVDGAFSFDLPPFETIGDWAVGIVPRDDAYPLGNPGATVQDTVSVMTPPPDVQFFEDGSRVQVEISGGVLTASFVYPDV